MLAGKEVPDNTNIEWGNYCVLHDLFGVREAEHWLPVVTALGRRVPEPALIYLAGICHALKGHPDDIMKVIQGLPSK